MKCECCRAYECYGNEHKHDWRCFNSSTCEGNGNNQKLRVVIVPFGNCSEYKMLDVRHVTNIFIEFKWVDSIPTPANCSCLYFHISFSSCGMFASDALRSTGTYIFSLFARLTKRFSFHFRVEPRTTQKSDTSRRNFIRMMCVRLIGAIHNWILQ